MKEISVFIRTDDLTQVTEILRKREIVEAYTAGRSIITDYEKRTKDETIVPDWSFIRLQTKLEVFAN
jgi:hypothetical protein